MRQVQNEEAEVMSISISRFGQSTLTVNVPVDATVGEALAIAGVSLNGNEQLFVAGTQAQNADILEVGDILSVVTPKQAGLF